MLLYALQQVIIRRKHNFSHERASLTLSLSPFLPPLPQQEKEEEEEQVLAFSRRRRLFQRSLGRREHPDAVGAEILRACWDEESWGGGGGREGGREEEAGAQACTLWEECGLTGVGCLCRKRHFLFLSTRYYHRSYSFLFLSVHH